MSNYKAKRIIEISERGMKIYSWCRNPNLRSFLAISVLSIKNWLLRFSKLSALLFLQHITTS